MKNLYMEDFSHTNAVCVGNIELAPKFLVATRMEIIMKKKIFITSLLTAAVLCLTACTADDINNTVHDLGQEAGMDINLNIQQEDLDKVQEEANKLKEDVVNVVTDEEVHSAVGDLLNAVKDAATKE